MDRRFFVLQMASVAGMIVACGSAAESTDASQGKPAAAPAEQAPSSSPSRGPEKAQDVARVQEGTQTPPPAATTSTSSSSGDVITPVDGPVDPPVVTSSSSSSSSSSSGVSSSSGTPDDGTGGACANDAECGEGNICVFEVSAKVCKRNCTIDWNRCFFGTHCADTPDGRKACYDGAGGPF